MKELSIEEKARRYDEAIEQLRTMMPNWESLSYNGKTFLQDLVHIFPELAEPKDEEIIKWIRKELESKYVVDDIVNNEMAAKTFEWLEKQGQTFTKKDVNDAYLKGICDAKHELEKQGEQNFVDKITPKLEIENGKWYVCIRDLDDNYGTRAFHKGDVYYSVKDKTLIPDSSYIPYEIKYYVNDYFRSWTIEDAKDGDVLAAEPIEGYHSPFIAIFKKQDEEDFDSYCYIGFDGEFCKGENGHSTDNIHPATKEQCDLLFQKMKEAGYKWDAEKKEIQKPSIKLERDENGEPILTSFEAGLFSMISQAWQQYMLGEELNIAEIVKEHSADLVALAHNQQPIIWSEEDKKMLNRAIQLISPENIHSDYGKYKQRIVNWLISLKERYAWKPSDEQMDALQYVYRNCNPLPSDKLGWDSIRTLELMYQDLKKLKE